MQLSGPLSASWSYSLARFGRHRRVILRFVGPLACGVFSFGCCTCSSVHCSDPVVCCILGAVRWDAKTGYAQAMFLSDVCGRLCDLLSEAPWLSCTVGGPKKNKNNKRGAHWRGVCHSVKRLRSEVPAPPVTIVFDQPEGVTKSRLMLGACCSKSSWFLCGVCVENNFVSAARLLLMFFSVWSCGYASACWCHLIQSSCTFHV